MLPRSFQNPSNFYKVLLVKVTENNADYKESEIVVTGSFGEIQEEESYRFYGELVNHPKYGVQLKVDSYQQEQPTSEQGLINYLSGEKFPGIGKKTAEKNCGAFRRSGDRSHVRGPGIVGANSWIE